MTNGRQTVHYLILLLIAISFVTIISTSTSPLYLYVENLDSQVFQLIGKYWAKGHVPYVDLWDQKGPIIYFINAIGFWATGTKTGVYLIQILCLYADLLILYRIFHRRLFWQNTWTTLCIFVFALAQLYGGGNGVEEYLLPFLILGFYAQYKWINTFSSDGKAKHPFIHAALYGFILAFSLLTRLTNALGICAGVAFIGIVLIWKREWKNLAYNIISFVLGFAILFVPFAVYFHMHDAFGEMWYATILFNIEYASNASNIVTTKSFLLNLISPLCAYFLITTAVILGIKRKYMKCLFYLTITTVPLLWILSSNGFAHYSLICIPYFMIAIIEIASLKGRGNTPWIQVAFSSLIFICCTFVYARNIHKGYFYSSCEKDVVFYKTFIDKIPEEERDSFIAYNIRPFIYLYNDIRPAVRFFCIQDFYRSNSKSIDVKLKETFRNHSPLWIMEKDGKCSYLDAIIQGRYVEVYAEDYDDRRYILKKRIR